MAADGPSFDRFPDERAPAPDHASDSLFGGGEADAADLPADFEPTDEAQVRGLSDEQVAVNLGPLGEVHEEGTGASNDLAYVLLDPEFRPEADPTAVATTRALIRELIRRAVQDPAWNITSEYLFGEETREEETNEGGAHGQ